MRHVNGTLALVASAYLSATTVSAEQVNWGDGWALSGSGSVLNPGMIVGFDPQPEPPAGLHNINLDDPTTAVITVDADPGAQFTLFFGLYPGDGAAPFTVDAGGEPNESGEFSFMAFSGANTLIFELDIDSSSGGVPAGGSWVSFNPQPEPPAFGAFGGGHATGFQFGMTSLSLVTLSLRVLEDGSGEYIQFAQVANPVPLPPALVLVPGALALLTAWRRRQTF